ncbi:hypothetical protein P7C70_g8416, partial [Phenoliferia sp. Uapishka_3]
MILVAIAGKPGSSVGACLDNAFLGSAGVGVGALGFLILAKLGKSPVAQGFVFFVMLYFLALVKAQSMRYFAFSLLAIIMAFSGIYTSILIGEFSPKYLEAYLESYCWGFGIVLATNILILPISSEYELRELLVHSLEHISTFSHLIAKTYDLSITPEERIVREGLNQSIRADLAFLRQKLSETGLEVNWTRWSISDYGTCTAKIRSMQQALITSYSSLVALERHDPVALEMIKKELLDTGAAKAFTKLRRGMDLAIADIVTELAVGKLEYHSPAPGSRSWDDFLDDDKSTDDLEAFIGRPRAPSRSLSNPAMSERLNAVKNSLRKEIESHGNSPAVSRRGSFSKDTGIGGERTTEGTTVTPTSVTTSREALIRNRPTFLRATWLEYATKQNAAVVRLISQGVSTEADLKLHQAGPSIHEQFMGPGPTWPKTFHAESAPRKRANATKPDPEKEISEEEQAAAEKICEHEGDDSSQKSEESADGTAATSMRVCSFLFGMGQMLEELTLLHEFIVPQDGVKRKKSLRVHWFEEVPSPVKQPKDRPLALAKALAAIRGFEFSVPKKLSLGVRLAGLERLARSDNSLYAFKTACAVSVYAVFLLAPSLKAFFVEYGLTGGIITIVVAMAPTLGATILTFVLQIMGTLERVTLNCLFAWE